jgi:hypothetical protein
VDIATFPLDPKLFHIVGITPTGQSLLIIDDRTDPELPPAETHAMDLWIVGAAGAGSAKGVVVTNATAGVNGTVSLIDAASRTVAATFPVGA